MKTVIEIRDHIADTMRKIGSPLNEDQSLALAGCLGVWLTQPQVAPLAVSVSSKCECCSLGDIEIAVECHNSACGNYGLPQAVYKGWANNQENNSDMPGMWERADLTGGQTDATTEENKTITDEDINAISNKVGYHPSAWDCVDQELITAILDHFRQPN